MSYKLAFLPDAVNDSEDLRVYLAQYYESTASNFFALLKKSCDKLKNYPYLCPEYEDDPDYRRLVVGDYLVFYMVK